MDKSIDKTNLGYLGIDFQYKLVKCFIEDQGFFSDIYSIVNQNSFTDSLLRGFVVNMKDYYNKNNVVPSYETINFILRSKSHTQIESEEWDAFIRKLRYEISIEGYSAVKENAVKFFKQQNLIKIANRILEIAGNGDIDKYDDCKRMMDEAYNIGDSNDMGHSIFDFEDKALSNDYTVSIPTGIEKLDDTLLGGLDKGKVGLIIGSGGFGKTSLTTSIASYAASYKCDMNNNEGWKVVQIYFEDDDVDITRKHFSKITQVEARNFKKLDMIERNDIKEFIDNYPDKEMLKNNLRIIRYNTGSKSASDIERFLKKLINTGFKPDLVIIDYFECLIPEKGGVSSDSEWTREGITMRKIENIAKDLNIAIWVPTQGNKGSFTSEIVTMDQGGGSIKKQQICQVVISIARSLEDIDNNRATLAILKNRSGKSGKVFQNIRFDNGTSTISCDEVMEYDSQLAWKEDETKVKEKKMIEMTREIVELQKKNK